MTKAYRLVEIDSKQRIKTLFHGIKGSRVLELGIWYEAEEKEVVDGGGQNPYLSGFNVLLTYFDAVHYSERFKAPRTLAVAECEVSGLRQKPTNREGRVLLAKRMKVTRIAAELARSLSFKSKLDLIQEDG